MKIRFTNATSSKRYVSALNVAIDAGAYVETQFDQARLDREWRLKADIEAGYITVTFVEVSAGDSVKTFNSSAGPAYSDATRPSATAVPVVSSIWNTDDNAPNYSDGAGWRDAAGAST